MPKENSNITQISDLNETYPLASDLISEADDHLRIVKRVLKRTFANITTPITPTSAQINKLASVTASSTELNVLQGITTSTTELNLLDGLTAGAADLNKLDSWAGSTADLTYLSSLNATTVTNTEYGYLDGVTSAIQTQLNGKVNNTVTVTAGDGLTGGGALDANRSISHGSTSTLSAGAHGNTSDSTKIDSITLDAYGHVTAVATGPTGDIQTVSAASGTPLSTSKSGNTVTITHDNVATSGTALDVASGSYVSGITRDAQGHVVNLRATTLPAQVNFTASDGVQKVGNDFRHAAIANAATSINNSGRTYIQDITFDKFGHVTAVSSATETVVNTDTTYSAGTGMQLSGTQFNCTIDSPSEVGLSSLSNNGNSLAGNFTVTGNITATGNINAQSDERLKQNIEEIPDALAKLISIRGVTFDRIDQPGLRQVGVIAQEVEEVLPEVVEDGLDGFKSVAYGNMVGLLIEAIKEQQKQIDALKMHIVEGQEDGTSN
jgi:hypothetical protein